VFHTILDWVVDRIVGNFIAKKPSHIKRAMKHLAPIIEERLRKEKEYGKDWPSKPVLIKYTDHSCRR
jgi:hypothetical protein